MNVCGLVVFDVFVVIEVLFGEEFWVGGEDFYVYVGFDIEVVLVLWW